jgi:hypothetical protein
MYVCKFVYTIIFIPLWSLLCAAAAAAAAAAVFGNHGYEHEGEQDALDRVLLHRLRAKHKLLKVNCT